MRVAIALCFCIAVSDAFRLSKRGRRDDPPEFGSVEDACTSCLDGHVKNTAMPWCTCMAREDEGHYHSQCVRPKTSGGFYDCMCAKNVPDQATGLLKDVACTQLDPLAPALGDNVNMDVTAQIR